MRTRIMQGNLLIVGAVGTTALQVVNNLPVDQAVNLLSTIIIAVVTLIKLFKKPNKE